MTRIRGHHLLLCLVVACIGLAGCSGNKSDGGAAKKPPRPAECGKDDKSAEAKSDACARALFNQKVDANVNKRVSKMDEAKRVELAKKVCEEAKVFASDAAAETARPSRPEFMAQVGAKLKVNPHDLDQLAAAAEPLCPAEFKLLDGLPPLSQPLQLELSIQGRGKIKVTHTDNSGKTADEEAFAPWTLPIVLASPSDVKLTAVPENKEASKKDGVDPKDLKCSISLNGKELAKGNYDAKRESLECTLSRDALIDASRAAANEKPETPSESPVEPPPEELPESPPEAPPEQQPGEQPPEPAPTDTGG